MEVTDLDIARIPARNLHVPRAEFVAVWIAAERQLSEDRTNWRRAGVAVTCRWLARAIVKPASGRWRREVAPVTRRDASAYEELIEAECLAAEKELARRPVPLWVRNQPGWVDAALVTLNWAWRRSGCLPIDVDVRVAG